ncbi:MAG: preprotein translocase subunit SecE [Clostridia bacterium]|nr:preprotein translocase subunit SecE [Clostridia bacterium]
MAKNEKAAEKVVAADKKEKKPANPNGNIFVRAGKAIKKFCKDLKGEIKKIVWPDAKTVLKSTAVVLVVVAICGLAIFAVDQLLSLGLSGLKDVAQSIGESADTTTTTAASTGMIGLGKFFIG